ncbi:hypothetical protein VFPPC_17523 [Pochonia chlamydosporia 170]|uniref:Uncharacterized protein n=1 Tax=Pochonia chlamydosporia 170 TaxID=1380566 RepID=A0A219ASN5_METCM|nr:hypothetical protein VFPPC_17523 [Pochonia chlamydosporia 170]OWT43314.1 hypothetical protein VFPPC_17523 [Pochonia chlamydosporia 170]
MPSSSPHERQQDCQVLYCSNVAFSLPAIAPSSLSVCVSLSTTQTPCPDVPFLSADAGKKGRVMSHGSELPPESGWQSPCPFSSLGLLHSVHPCVISFQCTEKKVTSTGQRKRLDGGAPFDIGLVISI